MTDDRLSEEYRAGSQLWRRSWALADLSPDFGLVVGRPENTSVFLIGGLATLAAALTVYFSTINAHAPLLAPFVALLAAWLLVQAGRRWRIKSWTIIKRESGETATHIIHGDCKPGERQEFELHLADRIRQARRRGS